MRNFLSRIGKMLKFLVESLFNALSRLVTTIEDYLKENQVGEKIKTFSQKTSDQAKTITAKSYKKVKNQLVKMNAEQQSDSSQNHTNSINVNKLGHFLDGWAELIEGMGEKAEQVRHDALERLDLKEMPEIRLGDVIANDGSFNKKRNYIISKTDPGATTAIYIAQHGKDLYVSWRTWLAATLNIGLIIVLLIVAALGGYFSFGTREVMGGSFLSSYTYTQTWAAGWIGASTVLLLLEVLFLTWAGRVTKGNPYAYFFLEPTVFDGEDITAMSLSVHYAILRSLDNAGIDTSKLRIKEKFTGGRRGEDI